MNAFQKYIISSRVHLQQLPPSRMEFIFQLVHYLPSTVFIKLKIYDKQKHLNARIIILLQSNLSFTHKRFPSVETRDLSHKHHEFTFKPKNNLTSFIKKKCSKHVTQSDTVTSVCEKNELCNYDDENSIKEYNERRVVNATIRPIALQLWIMKII